jgi:hypothetical protein
VTATLPKGVIQELVQRSDAGMIFLAEGGKRVLDSDSAIPTNRTPVVWTRGYDGTGVDVAILETGSVDFFSDTTQCPAASNNCFQHPGATRWALSGQRDHATQVASVAASNHSIYRGMAPDVTVMSVGIQGLDRQDDIDALVWALDHGAEVVNASYASCTEDPSEMDIIDWAFDHYARVRYRLFVKSAGNFVSCGSYEVTSPGKGWNVLTVGAYDDQNNSNWSDDEMADFSNWINPDSPNGDREKPEVVAPGVEIVAIKRNGVLETDPNLNSGASFAAPQVAGLAALLIDRYEWLSSYPEANRAIIMASAVHNIEGQSGIPSGQDLKDGAGGIDAALADITAKTYETSETSPCTGPCWWGFDINNTSFPVDTHLYRYFNASRGERIRVAIAWSSHADCPAENDCNFDRLDTDLDLNIEDPDGDPVPGGTSASWDNSYELVDFTAPKTGQYKIAVYKARADEDSNYLGVAWVKDATYLPDLRNKDGWVSEFRVCNKGAVTRSTNPLTPPPVYIYYSDDDGDPTPADYDSCNLSPNQCCWIPVDEDSRIPADTVGSAIVNGGEDIVVIVRTRNGSELTIYNGITGANGTPGWEQTGSTLYVPVAKNNWVGRYSSIEVVNIGSASSIVSASFYEHADGGSGEYVGRRVFFLAPNAHRTIAASDRCDSGHYCAVRLVSSGGQPLAAVVREYASGGGDPATYNADSGGASTGYAPVVKGNWGGQSSGLAVMNTHGSQSASVTITYYDANSANTYSDSFSVPRRSVRTSWVPSVVGSNPFLGSAYVSANRNVVVLTHESGNGFYKATNAFANGTAGSHVAELFNYALGTKSGISVQNLHSSQDADVCVRYYDGDGNYLMGEDDCAPNPIAPHESYSFHHWNGELPAEFHGSAWVGSANGQPIVVMLHELETLTPGVDRNASFNGSNR